MDNVIRASTNRSLTAPLLNLTRMREIIEKHWKKNYVNYLCKKEITMFVDDCKKSRAQEKPLRHNGPSRPLKIKKPRFLFRL